MRLVLGVPENGEQSPCHENHNDSQQSSSAERLTWNRALALTAGSGNRSGHLENLWNYDKSSVGGRQSNLSQLQVQTRASQSFFSEKPNVSLKKRKAFSSTVAWFTVTTSSIEGQPGCAKNDRARAGAKSPRKFCSCAVQISSFSRRLQDRAPHSGCQETLTLWRRSPNTDIAAELERCGSISSIFWVCFLPSSWRTVTVESVCQAQEFRLEDKFVFFCLPLNLSSTFYECNSASERWSPSFLFFFFFSELFLTIDSFFPLCEYQQERMAFWREEVWPHFSSSWLKESLTLRSGNAWVSSNKHSITKGPWYFKAFFCFNWMPYSSNKNNEKN